MRKERGQEGPFSKCERPTQNMKLIPQQVSQKQATQYFSSNQCISVETVPINTSYNCYY